MRSKTTKKTGKQTEAATGDSLQMIIRLLNSLKNKSY